MKDWQVAVEMPDTFIYPHTNKGEKKYYKKYYSIISGINLKRRRLLIKNNIH